MTPDPEETAALRRAADAAGVAADAKRLLLEYAGLCAKHEVPVPVDLETKLYAWLASHVGK